VYRILKKIEEVHRAATRVPAIAAPLRLLSTGSYRFLEIALGRHHPHGRVLRQAYQTLKTISPEAGASLASHEKNVLFFSIRGWYAHIATEVIIARALQARGAKISFFLCDGGLAQCDFKPGTDPFVTRPLCWRCQGFPRRLLKAAGFRCCETGDFLAPSARVRASREIRRLDRSELNDFRYRGLQLSEIVRPSVQRSLLRGDIPGDAFSERVLRGFLESAMLFVDLAEHLIAHEQPDVIVMTNGLFFAERIMLEIATQRGISAVTYERGMRRNTVILAHDRPVIDFDLDEAWSRWGHVPLSGDEISELEDHTTARGSGDVGTIELWPRMRLGEEKAAENLRLDPGRPLAVAFTNILWDSALYGRDIAFDGMFDWLTASIEQFRKMPEAQLVIRVHPSEIRIPLARSRDPVVSRIRGAYSELPDNVRIVAAEDPTSSYTLLSMSDAVLVYTSTIGLEAALRGLPVVVAGRTHYRGRGFTRDVADRADYAQLLQVALDGDSLSDEASELARRYAHLFFFRFHQPFPWLIDMPRSARRLTFDSETELAPGADPDLDRICEAILLGRPFVPAH
jgi:hypothetical protein